MLRAVIFGACLIAGAGVALAVEQREPDVGVCPDKLVADQPSLLCDCPSEATATGSVWGSDVYTDDSAICRSALHSGAIGTAGGRVFVVEAPGQDAYPAVTRNSVASSSWPQWRRSIAFRPTSEAGRADSRPRLAACPTSAVGLPVGTRLACACTAAAAGTGSVWGSDPYTADSAICRAAVHAGEIRSSGGEVRLRITAGRDSYPAGERRGVTTGAWSSYPTSLEFGR